MEKIMLFCVFSYLIVQISSSEHNVTLLRFRQNENITLNCSINEQFTYRFEMAWYHQNPDSGRLTLLLSAKNWPSLNIQYSQNNRMRVHGDVESITASLDIIGLTESDSGLYFCGTTNLIMYFNKPIRLVMEDKLTDREDKVQSVTDPPEDDEITVSTVEVMLTERVMVFGGVGLAVFQFFLATVVAGGIIHCYGWQKGWAAAKRAVLTD
ncbi:uncharacterized protein LOC132144952 isoform X2 [Carassius carassius]|uniref:uncharacterized protein LOC132144952 isoform X2 n=1 Tax=Carassius carassius TaxID=217509 RepID=UPI0028684C5B|nr:uncharacterized protein LOC132144952 isoform X2 [Carassius carassius]XP_059411544.1 uncharacterized protein LOC132144952 isoform X2 [Carassius carassius]